MSVRRRELRAIAIALLFVLVVWLAGVGRAAYSVGDFCGTEGGARARAEHPEYDDGTFGGFETQTKMFPPRMICVFHSSDGRTIRVSGSAYFD